MSCWTEIDADRLPAAATQEKETGFPYYMAVIGGSFIHPANFIPQGIKLDDNTGEPVKSKYPSSNNPYWLIDLGRSGDDSVDTRLVQHWKTTNATLQQLGAADKAAVNSVKKWLNSNDTAVWYHNSNDDRCSQWGGPHLHVLLASPRRPDGTYPVLSNTNQYATASKSAKAASGYFRTQRVKNLPAAIRYFSTPPRVFMGTRAISLGKARAEALRTSCSIDDGGCYWDDLDDPEPLPPTTDRRRPRNDFESANDENAPPPRRSRASDWGDLANDERRDDLPDKVVSLSRSSSCDRSQLVEHPQNIKDLKETSNDRICNVLQKLMEYVNAYEYEEIIAKISMLDPNDPWRLCWSKLVRRPGTTANIMRIRDLLKADFMNVTLNEMARRFLCSADSSDPKYLNITSSIRALKQWLLHNAIDAHEFVTCVQEIMDRKTTKRNTLMVIGPSNSGKTVFLKNTLSPLVPFQAQLGGVGNSSQFIWQNVPGSRALFIEECMLAPEHIETAKLIFGGEPASVDVKCKPPARTARVPVFITTNNEPWRLALNQTDKFALQNRIIEFHVRPDPDLAKLDKQIHPGIWYYLTQALADLSPGEEFSFNKALAVPAYVSEEETVDTSDIE